VNGDRQRQAILTALRAAPDGLDTEALARKLGCHPNTIRWHLDALTRDGRVTSEAAHGCGRGRPRLVHHAILEPGAEGRDDYRILAGLLATAVEGAPSGIAQAYESGARFGRRLRRAAPGTSTEELLTREGFAARRRADSLEMHRCPYLDLAERSPGPVCTLHRGIIDGALEEAGSADRVRALEVLVEPGLCRAVLGATE
jgi:predicted ArsR family transcriptional regulator